MVEAEQIVSIDYPRSQDQLTLLLTRWNALKQKKVDPTTNSEMHYLQQVLVDVGNQQKEYSERRQRLLELRKEQRHKLQAQLAAFKLLTRGIDLPESLQAELLGDASKSLIALSSGTKDQDAPKSDLSSRKLLKELILGDSNHAAVYSPGSGAEVIIRNRLAHRIAELEHISSNLGAIDAQNVSFLAPDELDGAVDELKIKALVEMKSLGLLTKQKSMRQHVLYHLAATTTNESSQSVMARLFNRRIKAPSPQDLQLTEHLERQQRIEREQRERDSRLLIVRNAVSQAQQLAHEANTRMHRRLALIKSVQQVHNQIEREEARKAERVAKQRLQALRANDEEAYIKLLDQAKDTRITHLLRQTNQFLSSLSEAVRAQQAETGVTTSVSDDADGEQVDYYEVAHRVKESVTEQPSILVGGQLKEYQLKGLQWMVSLVNNNLNGILADEMGLGKTIQSISLITHLIEKKGFQGPFLVIVPLSTITNWNVEFDKWAPAVSKIVYKGPPNTRKALQSQIRMGDFQVLLTTYEYIIKDRPLLSKIKWDHMIIDEGHRMKNAQSKLSSTLVQYYYSRYRLILTGTPLQNNLPELWALLNFVLPKIFNSVKTFDEWFNTPFANTGGNDRIDLTEEETLLIIRRLHKVLRPFLLRRLKKDVEKDLPDKVEKVVKCKMSALQAKLYEHMLNHNVLYTGAPTDPSSNKTGIRGLNNRIMQLRKICNHPFVFQEVEELINPTGASNEQLWRTAGKFELLDRVLPKFEATGHRVLMFFQMTQVMNIMEDYLRFKGMRYLRLDGATKAEDRSDMLKEFNRPDSPYFAFLLSTRAGGLGLNLQTADTVIIYDTDWNPFQDLQAQDRAHRIGQTKEVRILRLITGNTVEEAILDRAVSKLEIDGKVIQAGKFDNKSTSEEQEAFLRSLIEAEEGRRDVREDDEELDDDELNELLARNDDEHKLFTEMDQQRDSGSDYPRDKRLFQESELPAVYKEDIKAQLEPPTEFLTRRERRRVIYDDGLTDEQWLETMEESDNDNRRSSRRGKRATSEPASEPKKPKVDPLSPSERKELTEFAESLWDKLLASVADDSDPPRHRAGIFLELPSKRLYPDYYRLIASPISLAEIQKRINNDAYSSKRDLKADLYLMFSNARTYNEEGSWVYTDADVLQSIVAKAFNENSSSLE